MDVRPGEGDGPQLLGLRQPQVAVDVALGVNHDRLAGALAPDQVRRLGEHVVVDQPEEHGPLRVPRVSVSLTRACESRNPRRHSTAALAVYPCRLAPRCRRITPTTTVRTATASPPTSPSSRSCSSRSSSSGSRSG